MMDTRLYELHLSRLLIAFLATGLAYLVGPGSLLGLWNLWAISHQRTAFAVSPAWLQAHGHAEVFGWVGSFILGIGFHSLTRVTRGSRRLHWEQSRREESANFRRADRPRESKRRGPDRLGLPGVPSRSSVSGSLGAAERGPAPVNAGARVRLGWAWTSWTLWTLGVGLRWGAGVTLWHWRTGLPLAGALELAAFGIFQSTIVQAHRGRGDPSRRHGMPGWILLVFTGALGFLLVLALNLVGEVYVSLRAAAPVVPPAFDERLVTLMAWALLVPFVLGFSTRWLPVLAGFRPAPAKLPRALALAIAAGAVATLAGWALPAAFLWWSVALAAGFGLGAFRPARQPAKLQGIHRGFAVFVRGAYAWLLVAATLGVAAALQPAAAGWSGASRHALTVGFIAGMVLTIGPRVLPAFAGMRRLYSPSLMGLALALLELGCLLRVSGEALAYPGWWPWAWHWLPLSASLEVTAFTLFAYNLLRTLTSPRAWDALSPT